ncbi:MAG: diaminopimelate decarboxylase [candidate division WOR-3 bacterium]
MEEQIKRKLKLLPTPSYIYLKDGIIENISFLKNKFSSSNAEIFFAVKANTSLSILKIIKEMGLGAEVVSPGEIFISLKAEFSGDKILYNNIARKEEEVLFAIKRGIIYFNFESIDQALLLEKCAKKERKKIKVFVRINPGIFPDTHEHLSTGSPSSKFGMHFDEIKNNIKIIKNFKYAHLIGIHSHIGSQILNPEPFIEATKKVIETLIYLRENGFKITHVNLGGGFGVPYHPEDKKLDFDPIVECYKNLNKNYNVKIFLEPGRFIVANAGFILSRVISIKERKGTPLYIIDAGMTELIRPALYDAYHHIEPLFNFKGRKIKSRVAGPLCENTDEFGEYELPQLKLGDIVLIHNCGAYTRTMAMAYNGRFLAPEYLFDGKFKLIRKKGKFEDFIRNEKY